MSEPAATRPEPDDRAFEESLTDLTRPVVLGQAYLRRLARVEALPENQSGADKSWVEQALEMDRAYFARVHRRG